MKIQCSNCGSIRGFTYNTRNVLGTLKDGWGSYGSAIYCPKCTKTWYDRNTKPLAGDENTIKLIDSIHERNRKRVGK